MPPRSPVKSWSELSVYVDDSTPPPAVLSNPEPEIEVTEENAAQHVIWIRQEIHRFNRFVVQQLELIRRTKEDVARTDAQVTASFLTKNQELNREKAIVAARAATLTRFEAEQRERLAGRIAEIERIEATMQRKLAEIEEIEDTLRTELEEREHELEKQRLLVEESIRELRSRPQAATDTDEHISFCG